MPLPTTFANNTDMVNTHPSAHNDANTLVNNLQILLAQALTRLSTVEAQNGPDPGGVYANVDERLNVTDFNRTINGIGQVGHGSNAAKARPNAGYPIYIWVGSVTPTNATNNDIWLNTAAT